MLVPFHTPHADSFCHSWAITSNSESAFLSSRLRSAAGGACVGVAAFEWFGRRRVDERGFAPGVLGALGEKDSSIGRGAVEVK
jgi:hypothetical protein